MRSIRVALAVVVCSLALVGTTGVAQAGVPVLNPVVPTLNVICDPTPGTFEFTVTFANGSTDPFTITDADYFAYGDVDKDQGALTFESTALPAQGSITSDLVVVPVGDVGEVFITWDNDPFFRNGEEFLAPYSCTGGPTTSSPSPIAPPAGETAPAPAAAPATAAAASPRFTG